MIPNSYIEFTKYLQYGIRLERSSPPSLEVVQFLKLSLLGTSTKVLRDAITLKSYENSMNFIDKMVENSIGQHFQSTEGLRASV